MEVRKSARKQEQEKKKLERQKQLKKKWQQEETKQDKPPTQKKNTRMEIDSDTSFTPIVNANHANQVMEMNIERQCQQNSTQSSGSKNNQQNQIRIPDPPPLNFSVNQSNLNVQRDPNSITSVDPVRFMNKIPNRDVARDFFFNKCGLYCPPQKDLTPQFIKSLLVGRKKLLELDKIKWVDQVPNWKELTAKSVWNSVKNDSVVNIYFPNYRENQRPQRQYLLNVLNTAKENSVAIAVNTLKEKRRKVVTDDAPIQMTSQFATLLQQFNPIVINQKKGGLMNIREFPQCCLCLSVMRSKNNCETFSCSNEKHKAHSRCMKSYKRAQPNPRYSCPFRCQPA